MRFITGTCSPCYSSYSTPTFLILKVAVERREACQGKHREERFGGELTAPVPSRCQPAVDARAGVLEVVGARTVKAAQEEIVADELGQLLGPAKDSVHPLLQLRVL